MGDYVEGSSLMPLVVNIGFDRDHRTVNHVGLGFHVHAGSRVHADGFTWAVPARLRPQLQAIMDALLEDACQARGLKLAEPSPLPDVVRPA